MKPTKKTYDNVHIMLYIQKKKERREEERREHEIWREKKK
jgi:hypothetical protein